MAEEVCSRPSMAEAALLRCYVAVCPEDLCVCPVDPIPSCPMTRREAAFFPRAQQHGNQGISQMANADVQYSVLLAPLDPCPVYLSANSQTISSCRRQSVV